MKSLHTRNGATHILENKQMSMTISSRFCTALNPKIFASLILALYLFNSSCQFPQEIEDPARYYAPKGSALMVLFSIKPEIQDVSANGLNGTMAQVRLEADTSFQRAEFYTFDSATMKSLTKDALFARLTQYAEANGLQNIDLAYSESSGMRVAGMRSTKYIEDSGRRIPCTYISRVYLVGNTYLGLMAGAPASRFPTEEISRFLNSVTRK